jgi:hypothetical protein
MPTSQLTPNDSAILSALFDPESSPSSISKPTLSSTSTTPTNNNTPAPALPHISPTLLPTLRAREAHAIRPLNTPSPTSGAIEAAIDDLSALIAAHPTYAPAYLNRAQATRLRLDSSSASSRAPPPEFFTTATQASTTQLFADLSTAITLTTPATSPTTAVSELQADLLANAHTHRGYLLLKAASALARNSSSDSSPPVALPPTLADLSSTTLEELASRDLALGGRYGNRIAWQLSVQTNPYAKACGAIVKEALRKEREEFAAGMGVGMG